MLRTSYQRLAPQLGLSRRFRISHCAIFKTFLALSQALENTGVGAYAGQALNISSPAYISAALSIWSIEARHASVAGLLVKPTSKNISPDGGAFDETATAAEILKAVEGTGFLV